MVHLVTWNLSILAIALLYYTWRDGYARRFAVRQELNERVAYMLWTAANHRA